MKRKKSNIKTYKNLYPHAYMQRYKQTNKKNKNQQTAFNKFLLQI